MVRNPNSTRPYQHVLEPLATYLMIAGMQYADKSYAGFYNVGPGEQDCITTGQLAELFCKSWGGGQKWFSQSDHGPHEADFLKLDCSRLKKVFGWKPGWNAAQAVEKTVEWFKVYAAGGDTAACMDRQIAEFWHNA